MSVLQQPRLRRQIKICHGIYIAGYFFEALNFRGLLKLKHFADFIFEDRGSSQPTANNDFEALNFRGSKVNLENREKFMPRK